jgi:hypothetical protein
MKTLYALPTVFLILVTQLCSQAQCTGNLTPHIAPSISSCGGPNITGIAGQTVTIDLLVSDPNNDTVTLNVIQNLPASALVSQTLPYAAPTPYTVTISWTPTGGEINVAQSIMCVVTDPCTGYSCDLSLFALNPCNFNFTPSVDPSTGSCGDQIHGVIGQTMTFDLLIEDADSDVVTLRTNNLDTLPASATVTPALPYTAQTPYTVTVTWTPTASDFQVNHFVRFVVTDSCTGTYCDLSLLADCSIPVITCPADTTVNAFDCDGASVYFNVDVSSAIGIDHIDYGTYPPGNTFPIGTTTVTVTAYDNCGNTSTCTFNVTVNESEPPQITCPADITVNAEDCYGAHPYFYIDASSDIGIDHTYTEPPNYQSQDQFPIGTTTITAYAVDLCGNTSSCSFNVTVNPIAPFVDAGADVSTVFGYASTQTVTRTVSVSGGSGSYTYAWTLSRPLKCNQVNASGDELFIGGTCSNNICGSGSATPGAPSCSGSNTISATLLEGANVCVTVTDANTGCSASDCFHIDAVDGRCFTGNAGKNKAKVCHHTGSATNPWVTICVAKSIVNGYIANHPGDYLGPCASRLETLEMLDDEGITFFPNPFSSTGTIRFTLIEDAQAELEVFSSTGTKISTLFSGDVTAYETMEFKFDGSNLSRGIYLCKLTAGSQVYYIKMTLNK